MRLSRPSRSLTTAWLALVLTNLALLAVAGLNRREPFGELLLTERELSLPAVRQDEGRVLELSLRMTHQVPGVLRRAARRRQYTLPSAQYEWLDRPKLRELGFDTELAASHEDAPERYARETPRRVYLVLEYDGEAWRRWMTGREEEVEKIRREVADGLTGPSALADAEAILEADRTTRSRLYPVDAGTDAGTLRSLYPDAGYAVLAGVVRPAVVRNAEGVPALTGEIERLLMDRVHAPRGVRFPLEPFLSDETWTEVETREGREAAQGWPRPTPPRYRAVLAFGARCEPWLVSAERS